MTEPQIYKIVEGAAKQVRDCLEKLSPTEAEDMPRNRGFKQMTRYSFDPNCELTAWRKTRKESVMRNLRQSLASTSIDAPEKTLWEAIDESELKMWSEYPRKKKHIEIRYLHAEAHKLIETRSKDGPSQAKAQLATPQTGLPKLSLDSSAETSGVDTSKEAAIAREVTVSKAAIKASEAVSKCIYIDIGHEHIHPGLMFKDHGIS